MVSPDSRANLARRQAEVPLNALCKKPSPALADPAKGKAFSVSVSLTPTIVFESGQAKSLTLDPVKTEGSTVASASVTSLMAVEKVSGLVSRAAVTEINSFLFDLCKEEGVEVTRK